eukprot:gnl/Dysnectes_brevis/1366_a1535_3341.p1 GENE.gnl/Dysnectes_brevis/1366_a1535_3341~~gnl/Dysnectes_brevis/1366_a1535_3341.p1  ORF type:complete len:277 (-),score=34.38 gnl/Dysnectes_brevis/1366_a1535_3341:72-902(-)
MSTLKNHFKSRYSDSSKNRIRSFFVFNYEGTRAISSIGMLVFMAFMFILGLSIRSQIKKGTIFETLGVFKQLALLTIVVAAIFPISYFSLVKDVVGDDVVIGPLQKHIEDENIAHPFQFTKEMFPQTLKFTKALKTPLIIFVLAEIAVFILLCHPMDILTVFTSSGSDSYTALVEEDFMAMLFNTGTRLVIIFLFAGIHVAIAIPLGELMTLRAQEGEAAMQNQLNPITSIQIDKPQAQPQLMAVRQTAASETETTSGAAVHSGFIPMHRTVQLNV